MPALDVQPSTGRRPIYFGRALVDLQKQEQQAEEDRLKHLEAAQREERLKRQEARLEDQAARSETALEIQRRTFAIRERLATLSEAKTLQELAATEAQAKLEEKKVAQFGDAVKRIARLDVKDPEYKLKMAQIAVDNNDVINDTKGHFYGFLEKMITDSLTSRKGFEEASTKAAEEAAKVAQLNQAGAQLESGTVGGLSFKKPDAFEVFKPTDKTTGFDEARKKYPNAALRGVAHPDGSYTVEGISSPAPSSTTSEVMSVLGSIPNKDSAIVPVATPAAPVQTTGTTPQVPVYRLGEDGNLLPKGPVSE